MLSLQGNTAVYLLYAFARIASVKRKANVDIEDIKKHNTLKVSLEAILPQQAH